MEWVNNVLEFVNSHAFETLIAGLLLISESLAYSKSIEANGVFQAIQNGLKALAKKPDA